MLWLLRLGFATAAVRGPNGLTVSSKCASAALALDQSGVNYGLQDANSKGANIQQMYAVPTPMKCWTQTSAGLLIFSLASFAWSADVISIWCGARGTIVLKSDGTVWTWGANFSGKLGIGDATTNRSLVPVEAHGAGNAGYLNSISAIMGGELHDLALKTDPAMW
jgi:hypothetical protein